VLMMVTMGLTLSLEDFSRVIRRPRVVLTGLVAQLIILPGIAFLLVTLLNPPMYIAIGLIILACCPSGATSNFFSYLARGDVALSVTLTAVSGIIVVFSIPLLINLALILFSEGAEEIYLPVIPSIIRIFSLVVLPIAFGMGIKYLNEKLATRIVPMATRLCFLAILITMLAILIHVKESILAMLIAGGQVTVLLNLSMMGLGFFFAIILKLKEAEARSICIEIGIQNYLLSIVIALSFLKRAEFAVVPVIYLFTMYIAVFSFIGYCRFVRDGDKVNYLFHRS